MISGERALLREDGPEPVSIFRLHRKLVEETFPKEMDLPIFSMSSGGPTQASLDIVQIFYLSSSNRDDSGVLRF